MNNSETKMHWHLSWSCLPGVGTVRGFGTFTGTFLASRMQRVQVLVTKKAHRNLLGEGSTLSKHEYVEKVEWGQQRNRERFECIL